MLDNWYEKELEKNLDSFLSNWGPIKWREGVNSIDPVQDHELARLFRALSHIEDDAFYMQIKIRRSNVTRIEAVRQFNAIWMSEEAEHGRALAAIASHYGGESETRFHGTFDRDRRSIFALPMLGISSVYGRGFLAAYLALGSMQEYVALTTYNMLADLVEEDETRSILRQMSAQEGRHMRFYRRGAVAVLTGNIMAQRFVRAAAVRFWRPPGVDLFGLAQWTSLFSPLLRDTSLCARYERADELFGELPGMAGIRLMGPFIRGLESGPTVIGRSVTEERADVAVV